jgi:protein disulfide-isomerase A1
MKAITLLLLAILGFACASDVLDLTNDNFDEKLKEHSVVLVEFFAPWCGHCKTLAPKYEVAATQLKGKATIAKVDCTAQEQVCSRFGVRGYPTLKLFRDGQASEYNGAREADALVSFMKKQVLPAVSVLESAEVKNFADSDKVVVIGFFESTEGKDFDTFSSVAKQLRDDYTFGVSTDAAVASELGAEVPGVILFKKFDERKNVFDEPLTKTALSSFIKANAIPTMDDIGPQNYQKFVDSGLPLAYLFVTEEHRAEVGPLVETVAKEFKGKVNFVYIDAQQYGGHASNLNLKVGEWPAFSVQFPKDNQKFPLTGAITTEAVREHVAGILSGSIKPSIKSQPVPATQGNVVVLVGKNYAEIVNQKKDVLVEFYAPWCGHCKKLAPIYDELGDFYADNDNIIIAKMDATENDLPPGTPFQVAGFPTIKFIKADGSIIDYNGDRSLAHFKEFISENATPVEGGATHAKEKDEL